MRACLNNRGGFDRVLMAVAATFITVSATSAMAQDPARSSAAELAIDAAVPRPEPANVPPPTAADFKMDTTASTTPAASDAAKPADVATTPAPVTTDPATLAPSVPLPESTQTSTVPAAPATAVAPAPAAASVTPAPATPAAEPPVKVSNVAPADQPVADKLKDTLAAKSLRYFDRRTERAAVDKFYSARDYAPLWTQGGSLTGNAKGAIARLKDAASEGLNASDYPVPDFAAATTPDALADADLKLTSSVLDYARQAQSGRMHWSQVSADIQYPEHPT